VTKFKFVILSTAIVAAIALPLVRQHHAQVALLEKEEILRQQKEQLAQLAAENERLSNQIAQAREFHPPASNPSNELLKLRGEVAVRRQDSEELARLKGSGSAGDVSKAVSWQSRVKQLKEKLEQIPGARIPELQFLTDEDWLNAARNDLKTDADFRRALSALRTAGESKFESMLQPALKAYSRANNGQFPTDVAQLQPFFTSPVDPALLQRWTVMPGDQREGLGDTVISQIGPVDDVFDHCTMIGLNGYSKSPYLNRETNEVLAPIFRAYLAANHGVTWDAPSALLPYATTSSQREAIQKLIVRDSVSR
jgi:hypothetical protein